jgi:hypothetical protein
MAKEEKDRSKGTGPARYPEVQPPAYPGSEYNFTVQIVFEMQGKLGELSQAIKNLTEVSKEHDKKLDRATNVIYAAGLIIPVLGVLAMWGFNKLVDFLVAVAPALKTLSHQP